VEKFYHQIIDNEKKNNLNTKLNYSSDLKVEMAEKGIPKLSYLDPSDTL
jgi:hypothetical protein